jgi:hypothetical protein
MSDEIFYTDEELRSYLPSGWNLKPARDDGWDAEDRIYRLTLIDDVDFDWSLEIRARDAEKLGRLEALRRAVDRVQRNRLGWRTKGLLGWRLRRA